ncbi:hypothetical protein [Nocardiopsis nanhaiensis]
MATALDHNPVAARALHEVETTTTPISPEHFARLTGYAGRNQAPYLLATAWHRGLITTATLAAHVGDAWSGAEFPDRALEHHEWLELFDTAGFTIDGRPAPRPARPVTLWRGSVLEARANWSWTTDRAMAARYASGEMNGRLPGRVYRVTAPPHALLAANNGRTEAEYVVDTWGLTIEADDTEEAA